MKLQSEVCIVCETKRKEGIYVYNNLICYECEKDMVNTETDDPKYIHYLKQTSKIRSIIFLNRHMPIIFLFCIIDRE